ncbi:MAG TPA: cell division protein ZapA [Aequorivita sp.]|jgi:cell division protein ZapA|nr:cell division protein ZapA [Aequorivita sp.]MBP40934.1 cell division protein ZapA [Aequorivita sp.]HBC04552.1 cell division protein ZapA [Aequorivita sp.]HNP67665.1 cell division protein ZapA [Aequorivita sp.]|tara:strand:- start:10474 stop:10764 length:291 start_codon:yes stop_codon:yes gene_type:complete
MAEPLKIKLSIADRVYPLTINPSQEEGLRLASKKIEEMIKKFEQSYAVRDKQDVLAMCALQFAAQVEQKQIDNSSDTQETEARLNALDRLLQEQLS